MAANGECHAHTGKLGVRQGQEGGVWVRILVGAFQFGGVGCTGHPEWWGWEVLQNGMYSVAEAVGVRWGRESL